jgi:hypothetical protein
VTKHYTNFEESSVGSAPTGFTKRFNYVDTPADYDTLDVRYETPPVKRRILYVKMAASFSHVDIAMLSFDAMDATADADVACCYVPTEGVSSFGYAALWARASGTTAAATGYALQLRDDGTLRIASVVGGASLGTLVSVASGLTYGEPVWMRFQVIDNELKGKAWQGDRNNEPSAWTLEVTDGDVPDPGWWGVAASGYLTGGVSRINFFSGDTTVGSPEAWLPRTNAEYKEWLESIAERRVLFDLTAIGFDNPAITPPYTRDVPKYVANGGFVTQEFDSPANTPYEPRITKVPVFSREMSLALTGRTSLNLGTIVLANRRQEENGPGELDDWLRMKWKKDYVYGYLGDPSWAKHDYRLIVRGRLGQPTAPNMAEIQFQIADISEAFNEPFQEDTYATAHIQQGRRRPVAIGTSVMVEPPMIDSGTAEFEISEGAVDDDLQAYWTAYDAFVGIIGGFEVASVDAGTDTITATAAHGLLDGYAVIWPVGMVITPPAPLSQGVFYYARDTTSTTLKVAATPGGAAIDLTNTDGTGSIPSAYGINLDGAGGTFTCVSNPTGRVVLGSVRQAGTETGRIDNVYHFILFDKFALPLDLKDPASFDALGELMQDDTWGTWVNTEPHAVGEILERISKGSMTWYGITFDGLIQVGRFDLPTFGQTPDLELTESDVKANSMKLVSRQLPIDFAKVAVRYQPAHYTQGPAASANPTFNESRLLPMVVHGASGLPLDDYPELSDTRPAEDFLLYCASPIVATAEQTRLQALFGRIIGVFSFYTRLVALTVNIGDVIQLTHSRLGWKLWDAETDPASPDQDGDIDSRLAVVIGIELDLTATDGFPVKLTVFRRIPGYYPGNEGVGHGYLLLEDGSYLLLEDGSSKLYLG